jgi:hypothetical protein
MANININLNLNDSLEYDGNNKLCVKKSHKSGNTLTIESDGLYAQAIPGNPGSTGTGYPDGYRSENGILSGVATPESSEPVSRRIVAPNIVHRIFTCNNTDGSDIVLRSIDRLYPGDMYRVKDNEHGNWNYYLILTINATGTAVASHTGEIAIIPVTAEDIN